MASPYTDLLAKYRQKSRSLETFSGFGSRVSGFKIFFYFFWSWFVLVLGFRVSNLAFLSFATRYTEKNMNSPQKAGVVYEAHPTRVLLGPGALPDSFGP